MSGGASRRRSTERSKRRQGGVSAGLLAEQHQALIDNLGRKKRGHILHIVRRLSSRPIATLTPAARNGTTGVMPLRMWKLQLGWLVTETLRRPISSISG